MSLFPLGLLSQGGGPAAGNFEQIATATGTGSSGTITFSSIPATYKHLQIRYAAVSTASNQNTLQMRFNGDTGSNYSHHGIMGYSAAPYTTPNGTSATFMNVTAGYVGLTAYPNVGIIEIADYANTNKHKTARTFSGTMMSNSLAYEIDLMSGNYRSTSAISSITLFDSGSTAFSTATRFTLYGIKG
jgi:hypothetical protein